MRLTKKTDYCLRVLIFLQKNDERVKIQDIANSYQISKNHLSVAVNQLSELGYINSTSGPNGGIEFNKKYADKTVGDLVSVIEEFDIVECFNEKSNTCTLSSSCKLKSMISNASKAFIDDLRKYKIRDLV